VSLESSKGLTLAEYSPTMTELDLLRSPQSKGFTLTMELKMEPLNRKEQQPSASALPVSQVIVARVDLHVLQRS
jgi:hypothetical protein